MMQTLDEALHATGFVLPLSSWDVSRQTVARGKTKDEDKQRKVRLRSAQTPASHFHASAMLSNIESMKWYATGSLGNPRSPLC